MANCIRCGRQLPGFTFGKKICQWCVQHEAAQRGELADDAPQTVMPTPWVRRSESTIGLTQVIFGINAAVFLGMALSSSTVMDFPVRELVAWGANVGAITFSGEWWRLLTNVFVHGGLLHIAFNMWCLWNLGALCESLYGRWTYATIYLICGVGASLASAAWHPYVPSVGASGAIFGLAGALIAAFKLGEFSVPRSALSGTLRSLGAFVVYNLIFGFALPGIDNTAHIGGLVTGLIVGGLIALIAPQHDRPLRRVAVLLVMTLALTSVAIGTALHYGLPLRLGRVNFERTYKDGLTLPPSGLRLAFGLLNGQFRTLESDAAVRPIAKRFVHRAAAAAQGKSRLAGEVELSSVDIDEFNRPLGRLHAVGAVGTDCDLYLGHDFDSSNLSSF
jgi:rhomboid protease GluP